MSEKKRRVPKLRFPGFTDDWEQRKLGELVDVRSGRDYKHLSEGDIPVYGTGGYMLSVDEALSYNEDAVGIGRKGTIDKPYVLKAPFWTVDTLFYAVPRDKYDLNFVFDIFQNIDWKKKDESTGVPSLSKTLINRIEILTPEYDEQEVIGKYFANLDRLITLHQRKLNHLKDEKKSLLQKMFPKKGEDFPELRFPGFTDAWEQRKLGEIAERVTRKNQDLVSELPLTISAQYGLIDQNEFFDKRIASKDVSGYYLIYNGEFAYNKSTSNDAPWGAIKRLNRYEMGVLSTLYIVFKIKNTTQTSSDFLVAYYDSNEWHNGIQAIAAEGARSHGLLNITPNDFFETTLAIPQDIEEQQKIGGYFKTFDHLITLHQRKLDHLQDLKKALLQSMFV